VLFLIFTGPALIFSPVGEEVFCRGVIYGRVRASGDGGSSRQLAGAFTSAAVFATIHLMHHGLVVADGVVGFRVASGAAWFVMMFVTSLLFSGVRSAGASIWLAVVSHAAFNLAMNAAIFAVFA
jgi:membrane protease YdiL (CAAX protease family)